MECVKYNNADCAVFEDIMRGTLEVTELANFNFAQKSSYINPRGEKIFVLERSQYYDCDAYATDIWQFKEDFTEEEAKEFIDAFDKR